MTTAAAPACPHDWLHFRRTNRALPARCDGCGHDFTVAELFALVLDHVNALEAKLSGGEPMSAAQTIDPSCLAEIERRLADLLVRVEHLERGLVYWPEPPPESAEE